MLRILVFRYLSCYLGFASYMIALSLAESPDPSLGDSSRIGSEYAEKYGDISLYLLTPLHWEVGVSSRYFVSTYLRIMSTPHVRVDGA